MIDFANALLRVAKSNHMIWNPFQQKIESVLGIDLGTSSVKLVEISHSGGEKKLINYGEFIGGAVDGVVQTSTLKIPDSQIASIIQEIIGATKITTRDVVVAIPVFSSFSTMIEFPTVSPTELEQAVIYQARQYIPIPLVEVKIDWLPIDFLSNTKTTKVLVIAVPNDVINKYYRLLEAVKLNLVALELETFSVARALINENLAPTIILDMGGHSTDICISEKGIVAVHHNSSLSGSELSKVISRGMGVSLSRAEELKIQKGLAGDAQIADLLIPLINTVLADVQKIVQDYKRQGGSEPTSLILTGGSSRLTGLGDYIQKILNIKTVTGDSFAHLSYPSVLKDVTQDIGPSFSVAIGLALRSIL
ncbi:MAG: type IV pilus assembly protein PilM [Candidatus Spechtbacteria bacterium]|nr:type IV pilus assembly protein PilM [Candidatus Spechtbacteria bacterium]